MNIDVFHINGGREGFEGIVVEPVQGSHQPQIFRNALSESLT